MKKIILLALFMPVMAYGQIIENFETGTDAHWTQGIDEHWQADTMASLAGTFSLHHVFDNTSSGSDCIGLPLTGLHPGEGLTRWEFLIRHGYDPSSSNNWAIYLMSDTDPVSFAGGASVKGYALGVNLTGYDDTLRLWKIRGGSISVIITCPLNWQIDIGTSEISGIRAERTESGFWSISVYNHDKDLICTSTGFDNELFNVSWLILNYKYTSTRDRLLWLDDLEINGIFYEDNEAPVITECRITGRRSLEITFDEEPSDDILLPSNFFSDDPDNSVTGVARKTETIYNLEFAGNFINKISNSLVINNICDRLDNCINDIRISFIPVWAETGDVLFSEIMADPQPAVSLPGKEYLEITNRTQFHYDLKDWILTIGDQDAHFPHIVSDPGDHLILCSIADTSLFSKYGNTVGMKPFPALTDGGKMIVLFDSLGNLIHGLEYSSEWYGSKLKEEGGWSLEIIDVNYPFFTKGNWEASSSGRGGTPGSVNSATRDNQDIIFTGITNVFPEDSMTISIQFSETVIDLTGENGRITIGDDPVYSVSPDDPLRRRFIIKGAVPLVSEQVYTLHLSGEVEDFAGNLPVRNNFRFGIPGQAKKGDVAFNELLFNPLPDDPDYIELCNCSDKIIDISRLYLASINETGDTSGIFQVSAEARCLIPGTFYLATTDPDKVTGRYFTSEKENIFSIRSLPSMPDDRGHLILLNRELDIIDEVIYSDEMHYPLLGGKEGVSLEKIRPEAASDNSLNWHSASESSGWGTPGKENSIYSRVPQSEDQVIFSSGRISPDNDGYEDFLVIDLNLEGLGNIVTVTVFDETGSYIRKITENMFAGTGAVIVWDGTADNGNLVRTGIYILLIELFNDKGKIKTWKKVCTVIR